MDELIIVALGPDQQDLMTLQAAKTLKIADGVLLRTGQHGASAWLHEQGIAFETLDSLHDTAEDFDVFIGSAADAVMHRIQKGKILCYAVPEPQTDETVFKLMERGVSMRILAGVTHAAYAQTYAMQTGMVTKGGIVSVPATLLPKHRINPQLPLLVTEIGSALLASDVKLALLEVYSPNMMVLLGDRRIPIEALDRQKAYTHLSTLYIPESAYIHRERYTFGDLLDIISKLRDPENGCPWDIKQTHQTLRKNLIEEAYEAVEAINGDDWMALADELGDVLLQVVFHAQIANEHGDFSISDITTAVCHKMITRHAHIFGNVHCETAEDVLKSWEAIKKKEKGLADITESLRDIPAHFPALMRAHKVQSKAQRSGYPWESADEIFAELEKLLPAMKAMTEETAAEEALGGILFLIANIARIADIDPELALNRATESFIQGFSMLEQSLRQHGKKIEELDANEITAYWQQSNEEDME